MHSFQANPVFAVNRTWCFGQKIKNEKIGTGGYATNRCKDKAFHDIIDAWVCYSVYQLKRLQSHCLVKPIEYLQIFHCFLQRKHCF